MVEDEESSLDKLLRRRRRIAREEAELEDGVEGLIIERGEAESLAEAASPGGKEEEDEKKKRKRKSKCCGVCREFLPLLCLLMALLLLFLAGVTLSFYLTGLGFVIIDQENAWQMTPWKAYTKVLLSYRSADNTIYTKTDSLVLNLQFYVSTYVPSLIPLYVWYDHLSLRYIPLGTTTQTSALSSCILNKLNTARREIRNTSSVGRIKDSCLTNYAKMMESAGSETGRKENGSRGELGESNLLDTWFINAGDAKVLAEEVSKWIIAQKANSSREKLMSEKRLQSASQPLFLPVVRPEAISRSSGSTRYIWPKKMTFLKNEVKEGLVEEGSLKEGLVEYGVSAQAEIAWDQDKQSTERYAVRESVRSLLNGARVDHLWERQLEEHFTILERHISQNHSQSRDLQKLVEDMSYTRKFKQPTSISVGLPYNISAAESSAILSSVALAKINLCTKEAQDLIDLGIHPDWRTRPTCGEAFAELLKLDIEHKKLLAELLTARTTTDVAPEYILPDHFREAEDPFYKTPIGRGTSSFLPLRVYQEIPLTGTATIYEALRRDCELWTFALFQLRFEDLSPCPICNWVMAKQNYHCPFLVPCDVNDLVVK